MFCVLVYDVCGCLKVWFVCFLCLCDMFCLWFCICFLFWPISVCCRDKAFFPFKSESLFASRYVMVGITRSKIICGVLRIYWAYCFCTFTLFRCFDRLWPLHFQTPSIPGDGKTRGWWILTKSSFDRAGSESHRSTCEVSPCTGSLNQHTALNTEIANLVFNLPIKHEQLYHAWGADTFAETASRQVYQAGTPNKWLQIGHMCATMQVCCSREVLSDKKNTVYISTIFSYLGHNMSQLYLSILLQLLSLRVGKARSLD